GWVGEACGEVARRRFAGCLARGRVLVAVARIGGDDLPEGRPGRVDVDLEDRVRGWVLEALVVRVSRPPIEVVGGRVVRGGAPQPTAGIALRLRGRRNRGSRPNDFAGLGVYQ